MEQNWQSRKIKDNLSHSFFLPGYLLFVLSLVLSNPILAQNTGEEERFNFLRNSLLEEQSSASLWSYGWTIFYGANAVASYTIAGTTHDKVAHLTQRVAGTQALVGTLAMLLSPLPSATAVEELDAMKSDTPEEKKARLARAEELLKSTSEAEELGTSWIIHVANALLAGTGAAVIRYTYEDRINRAGGRPVNEAAFNFLAGFIVGEIQIFTQPTLSIDRWKEYRGKYNAAESREDYQLSMTVRYVPGGMTLGLRLSY